MARFITDELSRMGIAYRKDRHGNIYAVKGKRKSYPCVVAHMDEVHRRKTGTYAAHLVAESMIVGYDHKHRRMTGIGADDKNGIWVCLKCLESFKAMKCAFFVQEENGCIGSRKADMDFFADCRFVIGCDRKGNGDIITRVHGMELCSEEFLETVSPGRYGYHPASGLSTDVHTLKARGCPYPASTSPAAITNLIRTGNTPSGRTCASATALSGTLSAATRAPVPTRQERKRPSYTVTTNCSE